VVEHIHAGYAAQHIKPQLVAQKAANRDKMCPIDIQAQKIALHSSGRERFACYLGDRRQVAGQRCILVAITGC
jgi:hypothetical protein